MNMVPAGRVLGLTRVRNEATILQETLDHFANFCDMGIVAFSDDSTDDTVAILVSHPAVQLTIYGPEWSPDRPILEGRHRQELLDRGREFNPDWFLYFDADERLEWDGHVPEDPTFDAVAMKLWDAYITEEDKETVGCDRKWFGPEWRELVFLFRNLPSMWFEKQGMPSSGYDRRNVGGFEKAFHAGHVKHYGKAVSVEEWEETCAYYQLPCWPPNYRRKWDARMGKAVHTLSDFRRPLVTWEQAKKCGRRDKYRLHGLPTGGA